MPDLLAGHGRISGAKEFTAEIRPLNNPWGIGDLVSGGLVREPAIDQILACVCRWQKQEFLLIF